MDFGVWWLGSVLLTRSRDLDRFLTSRDLDCWVRSRDLDLDLRALSRDRDLLFRSRDLDLRALSRERDLDRLDRSLDLDLRPLGPPDAGDCFFIKLRTSTPRKREAPWRRATKDISHMQLQKFATEVEKQHQMLRGTDDSTEVVALI